MKKLLLIAISFLMFSTNGLAQNEVQLTINHKLGSNDFALQSAAKNNLNNDFKVTRLEYYISEISIIHDGGTKTIIDDVWVLVNASETTQVNLGSRDINSVEKVKFHIGVDPNHNHLDPSSYDASHPLAPKSPSMHWGWTAGYRFVAFEGNGGINYNQLFQLHGLGDDLYWITEVEVTAEAANNELAIDIDADYSRALEDINVNSGLIVHGDYGAAKTCLENFRDYVFTASSSSTDIIDISEVSKFDVFPNPAHSNASVRLETSTNSTYQVSVTNILGQEVLFFDEVNSNSTIDLTFDETGIYFVNLIKEGQAVITKKLISN